MSLLEVLIAVLVLAIGLLGVAALQAAALRNSQASLGRSQAVIESYAILDAMRAGLPVAAINNAAAKASALNAYNLARTCSVPTTSGTLVQYDQREWIASMHATLGAGACGTIACNNSICTVTVEWSEARSAGGSANYQIQTMSQI